MKNHFKKGYTNFGKNDLGFLIFEKFSPRTSWKIVFFLESLEIFLSGSFWLKFSIIRALTHVWIENFETNIMTLDEMRIFLFALLHFIPGSLFLSFEKESFFWNYQNLYWFVYHLDWQISSSKEAS